ncbi:hypothetical protein, partial [Frankia sp. CcWB2]
MRARWLVAVLVAACGFYLGLIGWRGIQLLGDDRWAARGLGLGVVLLPLIGAVVILRELRFGRDTERLARMFDVAADATADVEPGTARGFDPDLDLDPGARADEPVLVRRPSGRIDRASADAAFAQRRAEAEAAPGEWRRWYRLAV